MRYLNEIRIHYKRRSLEITTKTIDSSHTAESIFCSIWQEGSLDHRESFYALFLSRSNQVISYYRVSEGGLAGTVADVKLIFQAALGCNASSVIVAHNHPSGNLKPSHADKDLTDKICQAGKILELPLLDHLILSSEGYFSFADEGLL
ncbi:JAB domain-containing protein [Cytophagaceae bacterium DM2B3-1]|uniref:JAB domain-containing protein n=1 Tax=Xanthocytophaga flava TaxID=3048013 RepID=A0ABT7CVW1_9BACT|nr:JAB domain-containing protein [Xanthocytophaga flavus]MDJ1497646.1 JAB domain-containing protein [Xanthocytophaga flavus]